MSKNTFYFSHDYYARNDRKVRALSMKHGMEGIGVFWCIVEMVYEEGGFMPPEYERIAFELHSNVELVRSVVEDFELFNCDGENFWSESIIERLKERASKSDSARKAVYVRWEKYRQTHGSDMDVSNNELDDTNV